MLYDVSILIMTLVGVVGVVTYSIKMSRARAYPVGIVRADRTAALAQLAQRLEPVATTTDMVDAESPLKSIDDDMAKYVLGATAAYAHAKIARGRMPLKSYRHAVEDAVDSNFYRPSWICPKCGQVQDRKSDRCGRCAFAPKPTAFFETELADEAPSLDVESKLAQHDTVLQEMENRIRRLEKESVVQSMAEVHRQAGEKQRDRVQ